jgi:hypothetical protein
MNQNYIAKSMILLMVNFLFVQGQTKIYTDHNQYFALISPQGWSSEDSPNETIRSKVTFHHPSLNLIIRISAEPKQKNNLSFDKLYAINEKFQKSKQDKDPNGKYEIKVGTLAGEKAIINRNSFSNGEEYEMSFLLLNGISYMVSINAGSLNELNLGMDIYESVKNSFVPLSKSKHFSDDDIRATAVSRNIRLAELYEQQGNISEAIKHINEGLKLDPKNSKLKSMSTKLQSKKY